MVSTQPPFSISAPALTISVMPHDRRILCDVCVQYVPADPQPLGPERKESQRTPACHLHPTIHDDHLCELHIFRTHTARNRFFMPLRSQRWAIGVARIYEAVVVLEGRIPLSKYFANITLKKQIVVTALFECQVIVADFILVRLFALPIITRLFTLGSRYIAYTTCGNHTGGSASSPLWRGSVLGVCGPLSSQTNRNLTVVFSIHWFSDLDHDPRRPFLWSGNIPTQSRTVDNLIVRLHHCVSLTLSARREVH